MKKDTSRNFTTCVVTLFIIGSVLFSAVESVRVSTKRVKGEYHHKMVFWNEMLPDMDLGTELELLETSTIIIDLIGYVVVVVVVVTSWVDWQEVSMCSSTCGLRLGMCKWAVQ